MARPFRAAISDRRRGPLRAQWPIYLVAFYGFAYGSVGRELAVWNLPASFVLLVAGVAVGVAVCRVIGSPLLRWRARKPYKDIAIDETEMTVLALNGG